MSQYKQLMVAMIPACSVVFYAGYQVNRIDTLFNIAHASNEETKGVKDIVFDIHGRVCSMEKDIKNIFDHLSSK